MEDEDEFGQMSFVASVVRRIRNSQIAAFFPPAELEYLPFHVPIYMLCTQKKGHTTTRNDPGFAIIQLSLAKTAVTAMHPGTALTRLGFLKRTTFLCNDFRLGNRCTV